MQRNLQDRFYRERPRILSSLRLQHVFPWDPDVLDQIYQHCWKECTAVVTQLLASGTSTALGQHHANTPLTQPLDEAGPSNPYSPVQPWPTTLSQQNGMDLNQLQGQHPFTGQGHHQHDYVDQNASSWDDYLFMDCSDLDHVYF